MARTVSSRSCEERRKHVTCCPLPQNRVRVLPRKLPEALRLAKDRPECFMPAGPRQKLPPTLAGHPGSLGCDGLGAPPHHHFRDCRRSQGPQSQAPSGSEPLGLDQEGQCYVHTAGKSPVTPTPSSSPLNNCQQTRLPDPPTHTLHHPSRHLMDNPWTVTGPVKYLIVGDV